MCPTTYFSDVPETYPSPDHVDQPVPPKEQPADELDSTNITCEVGETSDTTTQSISFDGWL